MLKSCTHLSLAACSLQLVLLPGETVLGGPRDLASRVISRVMQPMPSFLCALRSTADPSGSWDYISNWSPNIAMLINTYTPQLRLLISLLTKSQ